MALQRGLMPQEIRYRNYAYLDDLFRNESQQPPADEVARSKTAMPLNCLHETPSVGLGKDGSKSLVLCWKEKIVRYIFVIT